MEGVGGTMSDPKRLLDSSSAGALSRALLESAIHVDPTDAQCDEVWKNLSAALPLAVAVGAAGAATKAGSATLKGAASGASVAKSIAAGAVLKGVIAVGIVGSVGGAAFVATRDHAHVVSTPSLPAPLSARPLPVREPVPTEPSLPVAELPTARSDAPSRPSKVAARARVSEPVPTAHAETKTSEADEPSTSVKLESAMLRAARDHRRAGDCAAALASLGDLDARVPRGTLREEREVLAIDALACVGRSEEAERRAEAFVRTFPKSPHVDSMGRRFER